jgi:hypothetical protein
VVLLMLCTAADQARLYRLIWQRAIASQMANAKIQQVRVLGGSHMCLGFCMRPCAPHSLSRM